MEKHKSNDHCTCKVGLGVANLLEGDNQKPDIKERRKKILNESIHFLGNCNVSQKCKIIDKINELKNIISEYYFDSDNKLIVIPNQIVLEDKPRILEYENERARNKFLDSHLENILHQSTANALREKKIEALLFQGFQSDMCLRDKLDKCKNMRNEDKKGSNLSYPDLNRHELDVMEMLDIEHLSDVDLVEIINQHESKVLGRVVEDSSWIVSQGQKYAFYFL